MREERHILDQTKIFHPVCIEHFVNQDAITARQGLADRCQLSRWWMVAVISGMER
jgi:hypothetical protein